MATLNGKTVDQLVGKTVAAIVSEHEYNLEHIAVELNQHILPKTAYQATTINDNDSLEIVSFVGGG